jgi:hypothetical protein
MAKQHQLHHRHYLNRAHKDSRLATGGGGGYAEDKQRKYRDREQRRQKILKVFLAAVIPLTVLVLLFAPSRGGGSLTFLRSESVSAIESAASKASTAAKLPVPASSSDKSTLHKIGLFLGLQTKSPMSHPTAMPTMATPTLATPTDTPTMTPTNSLTEVHTKVLTAASTGVLTDQDGVEPSKQELLDQPAASLVTKHIVVAHCKEDVSWLDQLHNFDQSAFDPHCKIHIHI